MMMCTRCETERDLAECYVSRYGLVQWYCEGCGTEREVQLVAGEDY